MSKILDKFLDEYMDYIVKYEGITEGRSAGCYVTYLRNACGDTRHTDYLELIAAETDLNKQLSLCSVLANELCFIRDNYPFMKSRAGTSLNAVKKLHRFLEFRASPSVPTAPPKVKRKNAKRKNDTCDPCLNVRFGEDRETNHVHYADDVPVSEHVPGLCGYIEETYHSVIETAREVLEEFSDKIPVILSRKCPLDYYEKGDRYIAREIAAAEREKGEALTVDEIFNILKNKHLVFRRLGEFRPEPLGIIIYYQNFNTNDPFLFRAMIANILAHEYMHFLEWEHCRRFGEVFYKNKYLSEGMADFFGLLHSVRCIGSEHIQVAEDCYNEWVKFQGSGWPYAEALRFFTVCNSTMGFKSDYCDYVAHGSVPKLREVFATCHRAVQAYNIMKNT